MLLKKCMNESPVLPGPLPTPVPDSQTEIGIPSWAVVLSAGLEAFLPRQLPPLMDSIPTFSHTIKSTSLVSSCVKDRVRQAPDQINTLSQWAIKTGGQCAAHPGHALVFNWDYGELPDLYMKGLAQIMGF